MGPRAPKALVVGTLVACLLALSACGDDDASSSSTGGGGSAAGEPVNVAFFGFTTANAFAQATFAGIEEAAKGNGATVEFFDGKLDPRAQVAQIQDAITSGKYQAFIIQAIDGNSVVPAVREAVEAGIAVVGEYTAIGTDYQTIDPQVDGMASFVGVSVAENGQRTAQLGRKACKGIDPCRVVYLQGIPSVPLDKARTEAVLSELHKDSNIEVVDTPVGGYTSAEGLKATQNVLQAHSDVNVILGSPQAILGAMRAVEEAGRQGDVKLIASSAPKQVIDAIRDGAIWGAVVDVERDAGKKAGEIAIAAARGEKVPSSVNTGDLSPVPGQLGTKRTIPADFEGQWESQ